RGWPRLPWRRPRRQGTIDHMTAQPQPGTPEQTVPKLTIRDLQFDLSQVPRDWHPAGSAVTTFFDNLSLFFPPGERFFVASVKAHANRVTDPELAECVR